MRFKTGYGLSIENVGNWTFTNEKDRDEMAMSFYEELAYESFMYEYNIQGKYFEEEYLNKYKMCADPIKALWTDRFVLCCTMAMEQMFFYRTVIMEE